MGLVASEDRCTLAVTPNLTVTVSTSVPSRLNFRIKPLQFDPCFVDRELPIDGSLLLVHTRVTPLQVRQELRPFLFGSGFPHHLAAITGLLLAGRFPCPPIRQQVVHRERLGMDLMGIQRGHQRRSLDNNPNPGVAMAVHSTLVALGQTKPSL